MSFLELCWVLEMLFLIRFLRFLMRFLMRFLRLHRVSKRLSACPSAVFSCAFFSYLFLRIFLCLFLCPRISMQLIMPVPYAFFLSYAESFHLLLALLGTVVSCYLSNALFNFSCPFSDCARTPNVFSDVFSDAFLQAVVGYQNPPPDATRSIPSPAPRCHPRCRL